MGKIDTNGEFLTLVLIILGPRLSTEAPVGKDMLRIMRVYIVLG